MYNDVAWKIIDYWVNTDYKGDQNSLVEEVGNLDEYAYRIATVLEENNIGTSTIEYCAGMVELYL